MICFCSYKNELLFFNRQELLQKAKDKYPNCGGEGKAPKHYIENKEVMEEISEETYQKK